MEATELKQDKETFRKEEVVQAPNDLTSDGECGGEQGGRFISNSSLCLGNKIAPLDEAFSTTGVPGTE